MYPDLFRPVLVMLAAAFVLVVVIVIPPALFLAFGPREHVSPPPFTPPACGYVMFCPTPSPTVTVQEMPR